MLTACFSLEGPVAVADHEHHVNTNFARCTIAHQARAQQWQWIGCVRAAATKQTRITHTYQQSTFHVRSSSIFAKAERRATPRPNVRAWFQIYPYEPHL